MDFLTVHNWPLIMIKSQRMSRRLIHSLVRPVGGALLCAAVSFACGGGLRDYNQVSLIVSLPEASDEAANEAANEAVLVLQAQALGQC